MAYIIQVGTQGPPGSSGFSGVGLSGFSGYSGDSTSGFSGYSGDSTSGFSGITGSAGVSGFSGYSGGTGINGTSGFSGTSGYSGDNPGSSGFSGFRGSQIHLTAATDVIPPDDGIGVDGDFAIGANNEKWGPKSGGSWIGTLQATAWGYSGFSGVDGTSGFSGFEGVHGSVIISGTFGGFYPSDFYGDNGDYFIDTDTGRFGGPKAADTWSSSTVISTSGYSGYSGYDGTSGFSGYPVTGIVTYNLSNVTPDQLPSVYGAPNDVNGWYVIDSATQLLWGPNTGTSWLGPKDMVGTNMLFSALAGFTPAGPTSYGAPNERPGYLLFDTDETKMWSWNGSAWSASYGLSGFSGFAGDSGYSGFSGLDGAEGLSGFSGIDGLEGLSGFSGVEGTSGFSGLDGAAASSGFSGYSGATGAGTSGFSGYSGTNGSVGTSGFSGVGTSGFSGTNGSVGTSGFSGYSAASGGGLSGFSGISVAGRVITRYTAPDATIQFTQPAFSRNRIIHFVPVIATTTPTPYGLGQFTADGSFSYNSLATTSTQTRIPSMTMTVSASSDQSRASLYSSYATTGAWRGNASGKGGFFAHFRFSQSVNLSGCHAYAGLLGATYDTLNIQPSAANNSIIMGYDSTSGTGSNWQLFVRSGTTTTTVDLGASAVRNTTDVYDFYIYCAPNDSKITTRVVNLTSGTVVRDNVETSTNLPTNTTFMGPSVGVKNNSGGSASPSIIIYGIYVESFIENANL